MGFFDFFKHRVEDNQAFNPADDQPTISMEFVPQDNLILENELSYGDILMLDWLNGKQTNKKVPGYFVERFQINPLAAIQRLELHRIVRIISFTIHIYEGRIIQL